MAYLVRATVVRQGDLWKMVLYYNTGREQCLFRNSFPECADYLEDKGLSQLGISSIWVKE